MPILHRNLNVFFVFIFIFFMVVFLTGCAREGLYENPDELVDQVLSQLIHNEHIVLQGSTETTISGYTYREPASVLKQNNQQWIMLSEDHGQRNGGSSWNTLLNFEQLQNVKKDVSLHRNSIDDENLLVMQLDIDPHELKNLISMNLLHKLEQIEQSTSSSSMISTQQLQDRQRAIMQAKEKLIEMLDTLYSESRYRIGVDQNSHQAKTLQVETTLKYNSQGQERTETIIGTYQFHMSNLLFLNE